MVSSSSATLSISFRGLNVSTSWLKSGLCEIETCLDDGGVVTTSKDWRRFDFKADFGGGAVMQKVINEQTLATHYNSCNKL